MATYCNFQVGDCVVRIGGDDSFDERDVTPEFNKVYVVRAIDTVPESCVCYCRGQVYILLKEIINSPAGCLCGFEGEPGFLAKYFEKVVTRDATAEVEKLKRLVEPARLKEPV